MASIRPSIAAELWPPLPLEEWDDTRATLHLWTQIIGKTRLALAPMENHWWQVALYVTPRGLTTSSIPHGRRAFDVEFDFLEHRLIVRASDGETRTLPLIAQTVAEFHERYRGLLHDLDLDVRIHGRPSEIADAIPFAEDRIHALYDPEAAQRFWRVLLQIDRVMKRFRGRFLGKSSPVHFWWGSFDLSCTRFSGRPAPPHPGGFPNLPDSATREAYSHECISVGWWPGGGGAPILEPTFYAYAYPEPPGCPEADVRPSGAGYHLGLREWTLPYEVVRGAGDPDEAILDFAQSTYEAAADLAGWDRRGLDR
jgi:hypothetical protein